MPLRCVHVASVVVAVVVVLGDRDPPRGWSRRSHSDIPLTLPELLHPADRADPPGVLSSLFV